MEKPLSHSRQPSGVLSKTTSCNGGTTTSKTVYDDVFGGPPRFGAPSLSPRVEEYSEIFGSFQARRASSIPVLDLPPMDEEAKAFFDVRSCPGFDYNEVFGGFDGHDYAVPYEELVIALTREKSDGCGVCSSDEEVWTPEDADFISGESDHSPTNHCQSNGDTCESINGSEEFNISYHKTTRSRDEVLPFGIKHVTQLLDVPGYAYMVDRTTSFPKSVDEHSSLDISNDGYLGIELSGEMTRGRHLRKTVSHPSNGNSGRQLSGNDIKPQRVISRNVSLPNEAFVTITDVSLKTRPSHLPPPSRPPPPLDVKNGDYSQMNHKCASVSLEGIAGDSSPPYFDVEVDASSSAAASAAAMKEAMEQAQAKLKSAKELMDRKKDGFQSRSRPSSKNARKAKDEKAVKIVDGSGCREDERSWTTSVKENGLQYSLLEGRQQVSVSTQIIPDSLQGINHLPEAKHSKEKNAGEFLLSQDFRKIDGADEWKEATEFFELVKTEQSRRAFDQPNNENIWVQNINIHDQEKKNKKAIKETDQQEQEKKKKVVRADHVIECEKNLGVSKEASEKNEFFGRSAAGKSSKAGIVPSRQKALEEKVQAGDKQYIREESKENFSKGPHPVETEKNLSMQGLLETQENIGTESKCATKEVTQCNGKGSQPQEINKNMECKKRFSLGLEGNEESQNLIFEQENESKVKMALEEAQHERRLQQALDLEEQKRMKEACERDENEKKLKEAYQKEENEKRLREAFEWEESERRLREALEKEENERRQREAAEKEENERRENEAHERDEHEKRLKSALEQEENERRQKEAVKQEVYEKIPREACEREKIEKKLEEALAPEEENEREDAHAREEAGKRCEETSESGEVIEEAPRCEEIVNRVIDACEQERNGKSRWAEIGEELEMAKKEACEIEEILEACEWQEIEVNPKNAGKNCELEGLEENGKDCTPLNQACKLDDCAKCGHEVDGEKQKATADTGKNNFDETKSESQVDFGMSKKRKDEEDKRDDIMSSRVLQELVETRRKIEATQPSTHITAKQFDACHNTEKKVKNINEPSEKETERLRREKKLEEERLRKVEEEREREREREKDRMAVDRAALEAQDRAYTEARERAERTAMERATAEARQRALNEARERLEKACAEAREKSQSDKASAEARLRAERAAVERAAAEARERAFEKAMAERAAFQARERMERSASEKLSASRTNGMRPSTSSSDLQDLPSQSAGSINGARYQNASVYNNSCSTEIYEGIEGESAQRCKARLERHRRTAERAAKALAEKNMRDLLVQREQAERNRLAETLDAEVKRWSSGKEGNLRALLSTLQYILGPSCGWQPIPLTEVITAAAVKRAYRKATLCVHPDKLQQRGASIHHKYICEKVFDLLKEAWNKFNSEER